MKLSFHGADQGVTGSCHMLEVGGLKILVDCGLYQGAHEMVEENAAEFHFNPKEIDYLLLTHAHLDHCGRIPLLVKRGFRGEIITTSASRELTRLILLDAAHLQEEDAKRLQRRARRAEKPLPTALYTVADVMWSFDFFGRTAKYSRPIELNPEVSISFSDAGHILGAASILVKSKSKGQTSRILFSGDLGGNGHPIVCPPDSPPECDFVVMETTYGDRRHRPLMASVEELYDAINHTFERGGNVIIPAFALERSQEILFFLRKGIERGRLPHHLPVFLDSPMAISATEIMRRHSECFNPETLQIFNQTGDPFALPGLRFTRESSASMAINNIISSAIIMAGSGMCTGGRIRHHLRHNLWREKSSVIFVGYASEGTLARQIIDGASSVDIFGEPVKVRAKIYTINGFSAHADQTELLAWHAKTGKPTTTFLVHGDPQKGMAGMATLLTANGFQVHCPTLHESVTLD